LLEMYSHCDRFNPHPWPHVAHPVQAQWLAAASMSLLHL
jgi:hypothetical protein